MRGGQSDLIHAVNIFAQLPINKMQIRQTRDPRLLSLNRVLQCAEYMVMIL